MPRPTSPLRAYARVGAEIRLTELHAEIASIHRVFPEFRHHRTGGPVSESQSAAPPDHSGASEAGATPGRTTQRWSAAQRKAVSARMKTYWAARRKAGQKK